MPPTRSPSQSAQSRRSPLRIVIAGFLLTLVFVLIGFPYRTFTNPIIDILEAATQTRLIAREATLGFGLLGPTLLLEDVATQYQGRDGPFLERIALRPALALSWLRGDPAIHLHAEGAAGAVQGRIQFGRVPRFAGRIQITRAEDLASWIPDAQGYRLHGNVDAQGWLAFGAQGWLGHIRIEARKGTLHAPALPMPIPYQSLDAEIDFGDAEFVRIERLELLGPLLEASVAGQIHRAARLEDARLSIEIEILRMDAILEPLLIFATPRRTTQGLPRFEIEGTWARPILR